MPGLDSHTKLLLHLDGNDGATETTDASDNPHSITFVGTAQLDTAIKKWGSSSLLLDGNSDYLTIPDSADWDFYAHSTGYYTTMDFWVKHNVLDTPTVYWAQVENVSWSRYILFSKPANNKFRLAFIYNGVPRLYVEDGEIADTNWHHVAFIKVNNTCGVYLDGQQVLYGVPSYFAGISGLPSIGAWNYGASSGDYLNGNIDEFRIQNNNYFNASPNVGKTDTIIVPSSAYYRSHLLNQSIIIT